MDKDYIAFRGTLQQLFEKVEGGRDDPLLLEIVEEGFDGKDFNIEPGRTHARVMFERQMVIKMILTWIRVGFREIVQAGIGSWPAPINHATF